MSVLIKGMEMPNQCYECFLHDSCDLVNPYYIESTRPQDCPLVEVPSAEHHKLNVAEYIKDNFPDVWKQAEKELEVPSAEPQDKCDGCFYLDRNGATCEFCARNYPDRFSARMEGEEE